MGIMNFLSGNVIEAVKDVADEFITTDEERLEYEIKKQQLQLKRKEIEAAILEKVHETNIAEAKTGNWFIAGWRPFIGWIGGFALGYQFILAPFLHSLFKVFDLNFELPQIDWGILFNIILAMLGMAGLRTFEKTKGVQNRH